MSDLIQMLFAMRQDEQGGDGSDHGKAAASGDEQLRMTPLFFMLLENMMPYLPPPQQKNVSSVLQVMELRQRFAEYADEAARKHTPYGPDWRIELLRSVRQHMPAKKQKLLDIMIKMIELTVLMGMEEAAYGD